MRRCSPAWGHFLSRGWFHALSCLRLLIVVLALPGLAHADSAIDFYKTHPRITLLVGMGPGSSYDIWANLLGRYMRKYMPGNPRFIVSNMPGAGSLVMANYLFNTAPADGTYIGSISPSLPTQALLGLQNIRFDPRRFHYIGSAETSDHACAAISTAGVHSVVDARANEMLVGGNGPTTVPSYMPPILNKFLGTRFKVIEGYKTVPEVFLAMDRNEVGGICSKLDTMLSGKSDMLKSGSLVILFTLNRNREATLPDVPTAFEFIKDAGERNTLAFLRSSIEFGRPYVAPPGVPADRVDLLRSAFERAAADPDFLAEVEKQRRQVTLTTGATLQTMADTLMDTPKAVVDQAKALLPAGIGE